MTGDPWREALEKLILNIFDSLIKVMDDTGKDNITRSEVMAMKLNWQSRMDLR